MNFCKYCLVSLVKQDTKESVYKAIIKIYKSTNDGFNVDLVLRSKETVFLTNKSYYGHIQQDCKAEDLLLSVKLNEITDNIILSDIDDDYNELLVEIIDEAFTDCQMVYSARNCVNQFEIFDAKDITEESLKLLFEVS